MCEFIRSTIVTVVSALLFAALCIGVLYVLDAVRGLGNPFSATSTALKVK